MSTRGRPLQREVEALLDSSGLASYTVRPTKGGHKRVDFERLDGTKGTYFFASSPSGCRTLQNTLADLRRLIRTPR